MSPAREFGPAAAGARFAAVLRARRMAAGLTQQELAARAGIGVRTVRELERARVDRPREKTLELLGEALGMSGAARDSFVAIFRPGRFPEPGRASLVDRPVTPSRVAAPDATTEPLPAAPDLLGREGDVEELSSLLAAGAGPVALVGLAGVGKSCLALALARLCADGHPGGVVAVPIGEGDGRDEILAAVASALRVARVSELAGRCAGGRTLIVLDGADRAPDAATVAVGWLREHTPTASILVTSRRPIVLPDVVEWRVDPLECPPTPLAPPTVDELRRYPAAALFLTRLRQVRRRPVTDGEAPVVAELVARLGGLPLALELAAARGRVMDLQEVLRRYGERVLDLGAAVDGGGSLRDAVEASYRLVNPRARWALRRLSVFSGPWSLGLAEALLEDSSRAGLGGHDVERIIDQLVGHGLVTVAEHGELRFRLLDVVRDLAAEERSRRGESMIARDRQARALASFASRVAPDLAGAGLPQATALLDTVAGDLRRAVEHASEHDPVTALRLAAALARWSRLRGRGRELLGTLRELLADPRTLDADPVTRARALLGTALLAADSTDGHQYLPAAEAALREFVAAGDLDGELAARGVLCTLWESADGGFDQAYRHAMVLGALARRVARTRDVADAENRLAWHDVRLGDLVAADRRLTAAVRLAGEAGDARLQVVIGAGIAEVARLDRRYGLAVQMGRRSAAELERFGESGRRLRALATVGQALAEDGDDAAAAAVVDELAAAGEATAGHRGMIEGYRALASGDRPGATALFDKAATALADPPRAREVIEARAVREARDVLEALIALAACGERGPDHEPVMGRVARLCRRAGMRLLPRDQALLSGR